MLVPNKLKHRKWHKRHTQGDRLATQKTDVSFGSFGLKAMTESWVTSRQIEAARRAMTRSIKRGGKIWIRIFPDHPVTNHGSESTMGGGKGGVDYYMTPVRAGTVMFEMDGVTEEIAKEALRLAAHKLPMKTKLVIRK
ncbi:50S ribosomal protein L16 [Patescibacteria group bacterium]|nr:50S ribosomal protein L16 [Patescibacteria group bacterium]MBU4453060.1 50S ribosomal protein L16 [Patescibacteria group bacterium]MCG2687559.1 50S ribosomal protein L16 [Candidatus Parcubacteria bacterium]